MSKICSSARLPLAALTLAALMSCGATITYSPEDDARALSRIGRTWTATFGESAFSITVCEDLQANADFDVDGCTYAHLVRSENPSPKKTVDRASSCEGCFLGVMTNVTGSFTGADGKDITLTGLVSLGTEFNEDPYAGDYALLLYRDGKVVLEGRIQDDGKLILSGADLYDLGFAADEAEETLEVSVEGTCGAAGS